MVSRPMQWTCPRRSFADVTRSSASSSWPAHTPALPGETATPSIGRHLIAGLREIPFKTPGKQLVIELHGDGNTLVLARSVLTITGADGPRPTGDPPSNMFEGARASSSAHAAAPHWTCRASRCVHTFDKRKNHCANHRRIDRTSVIEIMGIDELLHGGEGAVAMGLGARMSKLRNQREDPARLPGVCREVDAALRAPSRA